MRTETSRSWPHCTASLASALLALAAGCRPVWDLEKDGVPRFVEADYIDLSRIARVSRFRSDEGHDYSDGFERCRSMKHYFHPKGGMPGERHDPSWGTIEIRAPVTGEVDEIVEEGSGGMQLRIVPDAAPAFTVILFHVAPRPDLSEGHRVKAGEQLGTHVDDHNTSDVAVWVRTPTGRRFVSYFEAMGEEVFSSYRGRGVASRADLIISREERDIDAPTCAGHLFRRRGQIESWVSLR